MAGEGPVKPLVYVHVPKAAGTSLKALLAEVYAPSPMLFFTPRGGELERFGRLPAAIRATCAVVAGHEPWGLQRVFEGTGREPAVVTVLREPVARVVSLFRYIHAEPAHPLHARARGEGLGVRDVISRVGFPPFDNDQVRFLAGPEARAKAFGEVDERDLETAKANLEACAAFGLQERMDESLAWFARALRWQGGPRRLATLNTGRRSGGPSVTDEDRALIAEHSRLDAALHAFAVSLFEARAGG